MLKQKQEKKKKERKRLESWLAIASEIFHEPLYRIEDDSRCLNPHFSIHFNKPNKYHTKTKELLEKTEVSDIKNRELYNSLVAKCNILGGFDTAVDVYPLDIFGESIHVMCEEAYKGAKRLAENFEKKFGRKVVLRIKYPKPLKA